MLGIYKQALIKPRLAISNGINLNLDILGICLSVSIQVLADAIKLQGLKELVNVIHFRFDPCFLNILLNVSVCESTLVRQSLEFQVV